MDSDIFNFRGCKSIAIMGGTFDPIHYGHLVAAEAVWSKFDVDRVIFIPSGNPPHKDESTVSHNEHRYLMTVLSTMDNPNFYISRMEMDRKGKTYTIDTIYDIRKLCGDSVTIYFITGADALHEILTWKDATTLLSICNFIAVTRPGYDKETLSSQIKEMSEKYKSNLYFLEVPALAISSTDIRERVKKKLSIKYLLPESVNNYIEKYSLYKQAFTEGAEVEYISKIERKVKDQLSEKRFKHTKCVVDQAVKLALHYGCDEKKAYLGSVLHDYAKEFKAEDVDKYFEKYNIQLDKNKDKDILHGFIAYEIAKDEFNITDQDVLNSIKYHSTARENMSLLEKIVFVSDKIEASRNYDGVEEIRRVSLIDIDKAVMLCIIKIIEFSKKEGFEVHELTKNTLKHFKFKV